MLIAPQTTHDLKTERGDVLPPLPVSMRLIPILFYLSAFGAIVLIALTFLQIGKASLELEAARQRATQIKVDTAQMKTSRDALEARTKHAVDLLQWVEGSVGVQPLAVSISRSINAKSAITELSLSRDEKTVGQLEIALKLQAADTSQLEATVESIRQSDFRPFSAKQSQEGNRISYEATLIRQAQGINAPTGP